jgi:hypothetical protein
MRAVPPSAQAIRAIAVHAVASRATALLAIATVNCCREAATVKSLHSSYATRGKKSAARFTAAATLNCSENSEILRIALIGAAKKILS